MKHFVYITINLLNSKFYIGKHSSKVDSDGYIGSGFALKSAINKYGKKHFLRCIIREFTNEADAFRYEYLLTKYCYMDKSCYNMRIGGKGAMAGAENHRFGKSHKMPESAKRIISKKLTNRKLSESHKRKISKSLLGNGNGKNHTRKPINCRPVLQLNKNGNFIKRFASIAEASRSLDGKNKSNGVIQKCASGKCKSARGFLWQYDD